VNQFKESEGGLSSIDRPDLPIKDIPAEKEVSLLDLLIVVLRERGLIVKTTFGLAFLGLILSLVLPNRYKAVTSILPPRENASVGSSLMSQLGALGSVASLAGGSSLGLKNPNDLQVSILKSRTVEDAMVDRFNLMDRFHAKRRSVARDNLEQLIDIEANAKDGLIYITVTDHNPQQATEMANAYVEEFRKYSSGLAVTEASQRRLFFEQQLTQAKDTLATAEEELKKTEQKTGLIQLDSQARATISLVAGLRAQIAAKQAELTAMRSFATDENPALQLAEQQLAGLQAQAQKIGATSEGATNALLPKGNIQEVSLEYVRRFRDVKYYETIFELLARQYEIAKVDEAKQGSIIQVIDRAVVPDHRSFPSKLIFTVVGGFLGFFFSVILVFTRASLRRIASNPEERERVETLKTMLSREKQTANVS
jgi:uncharacterized protein involved in exopolysaccharide biosynthesis